MEETWKTVVVVLLVVGGGILLAGCMDSGSDTVTETPERYTLAGDVIDTRSEEQIPGVAISINNQTVKSGSNGAFTIQNLTSGNYTIVAQKSGYLASQAQIDIHNDDSVTIKMRKKTSYNLNQASLAQIHGEHDLTCEDCHGKSREEISEISSLTDEICLDCHPIDSVQNQTSEFEPNPHDDPHGYGELCTDCHRVHRRSKNACADCHSSGIIPEVP